MFEHFMGIGFEGWWAVANNLAMGITYVRLANMDIWDIHTKTVWSFRHFVGACGITHLTHVVEILLGFHLSLTSNVIGSACAWISVRAARLVKKNKHEVFAVGPVGKHGTSHINH